MQIPKDESITRTGSKWLRNAAVEAATTAVRHDRRLGNLYARVSARRRHQKAKVAAAREMLVISWHMLTKMEPYRTQNHEMTQRKYKEKIKISLIQQTHSWEISNLRFHMGNPILSNFINSNRD